MKYTIIIEARAKKEMMILPRRDRQRVDQAILSLAEDPHPSGVKSMHGKSKGLWRLRVGNYRIIYQIRRNELIVAIVKVGHRRDVYRGL